MNDRKAGWVSREDVFIPPIEKNGFSSMVLIRPTTRRLNHYFLKPVIYRLKTNERIPITSDSFTLGKGSKADFIITGNNAISRCHARVVKDQNQYYLEDLNSSNHTYMNEKMLQEKAVLTDDTVFKMADEEFRFVLEGGNDNA